MGSLTQRKLLNSFLIASAIFASSAFLCLPSVVMAGDESNVIRTGDAISNMSTDFKESGLPFKRFGTPSYDKADEKFPCHLAYDRPNSVFDLLLNWSTQQDKALTHVFVRDICVAQYMSLGGNRFFVAYRGIGVANVGAGKYSRQFGRWVENESISKIYKLSPTTSVAIYQTISTKQQESHTFYALFFRRTNDTNVVVQYAELTGASAGYVKEGSNEPFCSENGDGPEISPETASVIVSSSVATVAKQDEAIFVFSLKSKDCKTGVVTDVKQPFTYHQGVLADKNGHSIHIANIENQ